MTVPELRYKNAGNRAVLAVVATHAPQSLLDLGCGAGDLGRIVRNHVARLEGVTHSSAEATAARSHYDRVHVCDLERGLPPDVESPFDMIVASHVLEHLRDAGPILADACRVLAPSGRLIVALPNLLEWRTRWRLAMGDLEYADSGVLDRTHYRFYTFDSARRLLEEHGFWIERAWADGSLPLWKLRRVLPSPIVRSLDRAASAARPGLFGGQLLYVARPR